MIDLNLKSSNFGLNDLTFIWFKILHNFGFWILGFGVWILDYSFTLLFFRPWHIQKRKVALSETVTAWKVCRSFLKALVEPFGPCEGPMRPWNLAHLGSSSLTALLSGGRCQTSRRRPRSWRIHYAIGLHTSRGRAAPAGFGCISTQGIWGRICADQIVINRDTLVFF